MYVWVDKQSNILGVSFNPLRIDEFKVRELWEDDGIVIGDVCIYYAFERVLVVLQNDGTVLECQSASGEPVDVMREHCMVHECDEADAIRCIEDILLSVIEVDGKHIHRYEHYGMSRGDVVKLITELHTFLSKITEKKETTTKKKLYTALDLLSYSNIK